MGRRGCRQKPSTLWSADFLSKMMDFRWNGRGPKTCLPVSVCEMVSKSQTEPNWWAKNMSYRPTLAGEPLQHIDVGNPAGFVTSAALQPASFQARVFPRRIGSCRADGLNRLDANIQRTLSNSRGDHFPVTYGCFGRLEPIA